MDKFCHGEQILERERENERIRWYVLEGTQIYKWVEGVHR